MSCGSRAKQREFLKVSRPFFDKSQVRSFSSFEKTVIGPPLSGRVRLRSIEIVRSRLFVRMLESLGSDIDMGRLTLG
jgi:hypothetical protein